MEISGTITTGLGKAAYFLGQEFYKSQFNAKCGFIPFPGTLNIIVPKEKLEDVELMKNACNNIIKPDEGFGGVRYIKAILNEEVTGAIVFPDKTTHEETYLEFISKEKLRDKYGFEDGDKVSLEINI